MYDHVEGPVIDVSPARAVVQCAGIGFELRVSVTTSSTLTVGQASRLFTILHVVDGTPSMLGFATQGERRMARRLLSVNGVGPTMALAVLSTYSPGEIAGAVIQSDAKTLQRVKGVGAKTAERLCLELRDWMAKQDFAPSAPPTDVLIPQGAADAIAALVSLGYSEKDADARVRKCVAKAPAADTEEIIKTVLRG